MWKIRPWKTRLYQGFPGPFWRWAVSFYGLPLFYGGIYPEEITALQRDYEKLWRPLSDLLEKLSAIVRL